MELPRRRRFLCCGKPGCDALAALGGRKVPGEGEDIAPMAVLMKQVGDFRRITGTQRRLESREPALVIVSGLRLTLLCVQGLIYEVHHGLLLRRVPEPGTEAPTSGEGQDRLGRSGKRLQP